ncbi:MAG TPA: AAA family ATPase [Solirubrobacteraceae bacterium]|nr:AAA family ATPase [Solirubrobacteraceae bacterium]
MTTAEPQPANRAGLRAGSARPLLERDGELAALQEAVGAARAGEGRLVVIEGSAGIGKSSLLAESRAIASGAEMRVLGARAGEHEAEFAFGVVRQLFEQPLANASADQRAEFLAGAAALVEPLFPAVQPQPPPALADSPFAIRHGLYWLAANIAYLQPTCLIVDDLHWADGPSLHWLGYLVRRLEGLPLVVVAATRPPEQGHDPALLDQLLTDPAALIIQPSPLTLPSITQLTRTRLGLDPADAFCAAVAVATGGNPLFVGALLDTVAQERLEPTGAHAKTVLGLDPRAISRAVSVRLTRLPPDSIAIARTAAILGDGSELRHAAALAELDLVSAGQAASTLVRVDLLRDADPIEFSHPVVRSAVYDTIDAGTRILLHRRAAEILAAAGAPPERAAGHLLQVAPAGDPGVVHALRIAADRAGASGAYTTAVDYLRRALAEPPDSEDRFEVLFELGLAERRIGAPDAIGRLEEAMHAAPEPTRRARAALEYGRTLFYANRLVDAITVLPEASDALGDDDPDLKEHFDAEIIASARWVADYYPVAAERLAAIDETALHGGAGSAQLLAALAVDEAVRCGSRERATRRARQALAMGVLQDEEAIGYQHAVNALFMAGEPEEACDAYGLAVRRARLRGDPFALSNLLGFLAYVRLRLGRLLDAEADLREGLELSRAAGTASTVFQWHTGTLAEVLIERGELEEAGVLVESARLDDQPADNMQLFFLRGARGRLHLFAHEPEQALADFQTIIDVAAAGGAFTPVWIPARSLAALSLHHLGRDAEATTLIEEELGFARVWGVPVGIGVSLRTLGLVTGGADGLAMLEEAVDMLEPTTARLEHARTLVEYGGALRRSKQRIEARERLREGVEIAHRLGAYALVAQANDELAATGARPRKVVQTGLETLTASERRVAQLAADDMSNKDIAQALFVTVKTVEVHLSSVYRKLEISSRRQLAPTLAVNLSAATSV